MLYAFIGTVAVAVQFACFDTSIFGDAIRQSALRNSSSDVDVVFGLEYPLNDVGIAS